MTDYRDQHEPYNFTVDPPKDISDAALRISQDIAQRLNQVWQAFPGNDVRFVLVHHDEWDRCTQLTREAAEEIGRLRNELNTRINMCDMRSETILASTAERDELVKIANKLKFERDEARRWFCQHVELPLGGDGTRVAKGHGWDCFRESPLDRLAKLDEECGLQ